MSQSDRVPEQSRQHRLHETQERFRALFEHHPEAVYAYDHAGNFFSVNQGCCELSGYSVDELLEMTWTPLVCPDMIEGAREHVHRALQGVAQRFESAIFHKDGRRVEIAVTATPIWIDEDVVGVYGIARDITEKKRAEEALRVSEARFRTVIEQSPLATQIYAPDGTLLQTNKAWERLWGVTQSQIPMYNPLHDPQLVDKGIMPYVERGFRGETLEIPTVCYEPDKSIAGVTDVQFRWVRAYIYPVKDEHGAIREVVFLNEDISQQRRAEEELKEKEQHYRTLLEQRVQERTHELSTLLDLSHRVSSTLELKPLLCLILEALKDVVDYDSADLLIRDGENFLAFDHQGAGELEVLTGSGRMEMPTIPLNGHGPGWQTCIEGKALIIDDSSAETELAAEWRAVGGLRAAARLGWVGSWMGVPMIVKDKNVGLLVLASKEPCHYTQRHATLALAIAQQAAIAVENARLYEQAQRWAATEERSRLARDLHDSVTQALFSMTLHARTTRMHLDRQGIDASSPLGTSIQQLSDLTRGALAEMRTLLFELRPGALQEEGLIAALRKRAAVLETREGLTATVQTPKERVHLDPASEEQLYRLAQEALHNVVKHARARAINIHLSEDADQVTLEIKDDGIGFDPDMERPGHMGLQTMAERARRLGGTISVISSPDHGTTVRATAPRSASDKAQP
ncbi:MAG: PAS domain S-box protein [Chloroflexota bacterium]